ncbi:MAG: L,D-transpeptidase family protein, partial [Xanthobacteraceae bacterium]
MTVSGAGRQRGFAWHRRRNRLGGGLGSLGGRLGPAGLVTTLTLALAGFSATPASAQYYYYGNGYSPGYLYPARPRPAKQAARKAVKKLGKEAAKEAAKEPFGNIRKGPLQIFVSIDQQKLHLYSDGEHVADTSVATGVPSLPTPLGVFSVIQKQVFHRSNLYSDAPMPFMQRITWSGVALHEGESIGHRASHGCIRMPHDFAVRLYHLTRLGVPVFIAERELKPAELADPHLFVHRDQPPAQIAAAPAAADRVGAAPAVDGGKSSDAAASLMPVAEASTFGLRGSTDGNAAPPNALA